MLTGRDYQQFSLYYMHKIVDGLLRENEGRRVPVTLFTKGGGQWLEAMAATGCDALGLDWTTDIADARRRVGDKVALGATWTLPCSMRSLPVSKKKCRLYCLVSAGAKATSSTSVTVFIRMYRQNTLAYLWRRCIGFLPSITSKEWLWISRRYALSKSNWLHR